MDPSNIPEVAQIDALAAKSSAYVEAVRLFGFGTIAAIRREGFRVVWSHTWKGLWRWHYDARELCVELMIDARIPEDLKGRIEALMEREV
jgi:hypothetical protein